MQRNIPEERRPHLQCGGSLESRKIGRLFWKGFDRVILRYLLFQGFDFSKATTTIKGAGKVVQGGALTPTRIILQNITFQLEGNCFTVLSGIDH